MKLLFKYDEVLEYTGHIYGVCHACRYPSENLDHQNYYGPGTEARVIFAREAELEVLVDFGDWIPRWVKKSHLRELQIPWYKRITRFLFG